MKIGITLTYLLVVFCVLVSLLVAYMVKRGTLKKEGTSVVEEEAFETIEEETLTEETNVENNLNTETNEEGK